ncbi:MAG: sigma-70 family RNA polymerase sigma factor [Verrucomicrobiaceae bacterium]|nr:sigma-70 family RNA polymerase sigma factor [Verrucomicrobiaceae bacterium]
MAFPTTRWTLLAEATLHGDEAGREALARMCEGYRRPVEMFLTSRGYAGPEAEDLAQEFFLRWLKSRAWKRADRLRGRFRTFMLGALNHLLAHDAAKKAAQKRGGGERVLSLDEDVFDEEPSAELERDAGESFDRAWAVALVSHALAALQAEFVAREKTREFEVLRQFLPGSASPPSLDDAARALGTNVNAFKAALHRLRERFRELLRTEVARTVSAPHEVEEELQYLRSLLLKVPAQRILEAENGKMKDENA